jgi:hypothetical protein
MIIPILVTIAVIIAIVIMIATIPNASKCTGNCNQGRNCDCGEK